MSFEHYIPASFLALFSSDTKTLPSRNRILVVGDKSNKKTFKSPAGNVGGINNFYTLTNRIDNPNQIDETWSGYENKLTQAIDDLCKGTIDAETWARILVPFVTCLFVRGPDFNQRFIKRFQGFEETLKEYFIESDNINQARLLELQRLLTSVISAKWILVSVKGAGNLITSDIGYTPFFHPSTGDLGLAIPLGRQFILSLSLQKERTIIQAIGNKWIPIIEYAEIMEKDQNDFNYAIVANAHRFIFSSDKLTIDKLLSSKREDHERFEPLESNLFIGLSDRAYEFTWHRLVGSLKRNPDDTRPWNFPLDFKAMSDGWCPPVILPTNLVEFPPTLERIGDKIRVKLYDPKIYYAISKVYYLNQVGEYKKVVALTSETLSSALAFENRYILLVQRSRAYTELKQYKEALRDISEALELDPNNPLALINKGYTLKQSGDVKNGLSSLTSAIELDPNNFLALVIRSSIYEELDDLDNAIVDLSRAIEILPDGQRKGEALASRASLRMRLECYQEAQEDYFLAIDQLADPSDKSNCYCLIAIIRRLRLNPIDSLKDLNKAIELMPNNYWAILMRGRLYCEDEKFDIAKKDFDFAIKFAKEYDSYDVNCLLYAECNSELGYFEDANYWFNNALETTCDKEKVLYNWGLSYFRQGKLDLAFKVFSNSVKTKSYQNLSGMHIGIIKLLQGDFIASLKYLNNALDNLIKKNDKCRALRYIAISHAALGHQAEAQEIIGNAGKLEPDSFYTIFALGRVSWYSQEFPKALTHFYRAGELKGYESFIEPYIGIAMLSLGQVDDARPFLDNWFNSKPSPIEFISIESDISFIISNRSDLIELNELYIKIKSIIGS